MNLPTGVPLPFPLFLRREAIGAGLTDDALARATRSGDIIRVRHGAYSDGPWWAQATSDEQHRETALCLVRSYSSPVLLSHTSAAVMHGLPTWGQDLSDMHLTHLTPASGRTHAGVVHHRGVCRVGDITRVDGVLVTSVARTIVDAAALVDVERGLIMADAALHRGLVLPDQLERQYVQQDHDPRTLHVRLVVRRADGRSASPGESRSRHLFWTQGLPTPVLQYAVHDHRGRLIGTVDFAWPELGVIVEFDGLTKYRTLLRVGESPEDAVIREKLREDRIREATGWTVVRITWADLARPALTADRIRRAMYRRPISA
ncbi:MAG: type IV toxin-antitoxin system AbiEi family antitoxin domain-containing protein [Nocardioides sp.]|nr:type IV toxin-antitoxin system AbiEi family antitoxin domain-containing protein [Nocardioides sp.]